MLSPQSLERASSRYRRGYHDGYFNRPQADIEADGSFAFHDYHAGREAGANDAHWDNKRKTA